MLGVFEHLYEEMLRNNLNGLLIIDISQSIISDCRMFVYLFLSVDMASMAAPNVKGNFQETKTSQKKSMDRRTKSKYSFQSLYL